MITLTPLSASASSLSSSEPVSYLLQLDEARILLDLGQRDYRASSQQTSWEYEEKIRELAPTLSLVLLSHSQSTYLGLYPYARARWNLACPVYATQPTVEMGRVVCLAEAGSWRAEHRIPQDDEADSAAAGDGDVAMDGSGATSRRDKGKKPMRGPLVPTVEEIHEAFDWIKPIRYNQPLHLGGELSHLLLTPFPSGNVLGGTLFKIRSPTSGTVLYAVGMNHTGERHIDGMVGDQGGGPGYNEGLLRPDLLITEGGRSTITNAKRRDREGALLDQVSGALESNRSVLMPVDPSPRLLELLVLLDQHWSFKTTSPASRWLATTGDPWPYPLCLVSRTAQDMLAFARSLIEWFGGVLRDVTGLEVAAPTRGGRRGRGQPSNVPEQGHLPFKHIRFFESVGQLLEAYPMTRPKCVLAVPPTMSHGPSRWLFTAMAGQEGNVVILTGRGEEGTLARDLYDRWEASQDETAKYGRGRIGHMDNLQGQLELQMDSKIPLAGRELEAHLDAEQQQKEREAAQQAALDRSRRMLEADDLDSDSESEVSTPDDSDGIIVPRTTNANAFAGDGEDRGMQMSFDIFVKGQQMRVGRGQAGEMSRFRMFPFNERRGRKIDAYGEGLDIGQWVRKGREIEEEGETEEVREAKRKKMEEEEKAKVAPEPPSKFVSGMREVQMRASVFYVDMEGLHDGQAIKTIISDLQPRKLVLVRSTKAASQALIQGLSSIPTVTTDIFTPKLDEQVILGERVASYSVMLGDSILSGLTAKMSKFEGYDVAMVDGRIVFSAGSTVPLLELASVPLPPAQPREQTEDDGEVAVEVKAERETSPPPKSEPQAQPDEPTALPGSLFVGDLRLAQLKARLLAVSIPAEFAGEGVLVCGPGVAQGAEAKGGSIVAVRKGEDGQIVLEGQVGKVYLDVRRELYKSFARVVTS